MTKSKWFTRLRTRWQRWRMMPLPPEKADPQSPIQWRRVSLKPMHIELWSADGLVAGEGQLNGMLPDYIDCNLAPTGPNIGMSAKRFWFSHYDDSVVIYTEIANIPQEKENV